MIDGLMDKLILLLMGGFSWLAEIITPGHPVLGKLGPKGASPPPSVARVEMEHCSSLTVSNLRKYPLLHDLDEASYLVRSFVCS